MPRPSTTKTALNFVSKLPQAELTTGAKCLSAPLALASVLVAWQKKQGRHDLPWQVREPYRVWLSEIMLQQTQVATVVSYYLRFLLRFPTLEALANAREEAVLEAWAGLGYYSRARNLHRCAQQVMQHHDGVFPNTIELLETLPGIGRSTAAAIAVFCFSKHEAILDGNVKRVLSRVFGIAGSPTQSTTEKELWQIALGQLPSRDIESYTQGLMDLGASLCAPRITRCGDCPLRSLCQSHLLGLTHCLPTPKKRKPIPQREERFALIVVGGQVLLERQKSPGIWGGLLSFPKADSLPQVKKMIGAALPKPRVLVGFDHAFTHFKLRANIDLYLLDSKHAKGQVTINVNEPGAAYDSSLDPDYRLLRCDQISGAALPQPIKAYLQNQALQYLK
jgi:A/G-specific adenine glycosylase